MALRGFTASTANKILALGEVLDVRRTQLYSCSIAELATALKNALEPPSG